MKLKLPHKIIIGIGSFLLIYGATFAGLKILDKQKVAEVNIDVSSGEVSVHNAYMETADGFYVGEIIGNTFEGKGQYNFLSGEIYTGDWLNSKMDGDGCPYRLYLKVKGLLKKKESDNTDLFVLEYCGR